MTEERRRPGSRFGLWYMNLGLLAGLFFSAYCLYAVWNGMAMFARWPLILRVPVGLILAVLTFTGVSVAAVLLGNAIDSAARRRR